METSTIHKWYSCIWKNPTYDFNHSLENEDFFSEENGYSEDFKIQVLALKIGDRIVLENDHIITRID